MWITRQAQNEDILKLIELLIQLYTIEPQFTPNLPNQKKGLEMCLAMPELCRIVVVERDRQVVGMANVQFTVSTANGAMSAHIDDFIIDQAYRGSGAGKALMKVAIDTACEQGATRITVNIDVTNEPGLGFYRSMGFTTMNLMKHQLSLDKEI